MSIFRTETNLLPEIENHKLQKLTAFLQIKIMATIAVDETFFYHLSGLIPVMIFILNLTTRHDFLSANIYL